MAAFVEKRPPSSRTGRPWANRRRHDRGLAAVASSPASSMPSPAAADCSRCRPPARRARSRAGHRHQQAAGLRRGRPPPPTPSAARAHRVALRRALRGDRLREHRPGPSCVQFLPRPVLDVLIPVLLIVIAVYFALSPQDQGRGRPCPHAGPRLRTDRPVAIGFYDGIFGPGAGSFYMLAFVTLLGYGVVRATAHTKLLNFASNLGSLVLYPHSGQWSGPWASPWRERPSWGPRSARGSPCGWARGSSGRCWSRSPRARRPAAPRPANPSARAWPRFFDGHARNACR